ERQARVAVEVLHEPAGEPRVGGEFGRVHAVADDLRIVDLGRQVADPAAHQVEQYPARGQDRPVEGGQRGNRAVVDVADKARRLIEYFVVFGVQFLKGTGRQPERIREISLLVLFHGRSHERFAAARLRPGRRVLRQELFDPGSR